MVPTALGAQCNRRSLARASCPPALEGERRSVHFSRYQRSSPPRSASNFSALGRVSLGRKLLPFSFPPLPAYLAFSNPPQPPQTHSSSKPARKFLPTPTLAFRAALLRLRQSLPLEGAPVQQHPGPFTSPPNPSPRPGPPRPPCFAVVTASWVVPGLDYASGSAALAL